MRCLTLIILGAVLVTSCRREVASVTPTASPTPRLLDLAGVERRPLELAEKERRVVIFITHDCPIANAYAPEINRIVSEFSPRGVDFALVHVEKDLTVEAAKRHASEHELAGDVLLDPGHHLVKALGAEVTPEVFVLEGTADGHELRYRGRIDNRYVDFGKKRVTASQRDLREALAALAEGRAPDPARTQAIGCYIE